MPVPALALPALSSLTGGGALTPSATTGDTKSGLGSINVAGLDFGARPETQYVAVAVGAGLALVVVLLARGRRS